MKFRKKPVVIEAMRIPSPEDLQAWGQLAGWLTIYDGEQVVEVHGPENGVGVDGLAIKTLEGTMIGNIGDWIIRGVNGEFYPCKHDIFEKTYEMES